MLNSPLVIIGLTFAVLIALVMRYFIFRASCALVDAEPSHLKSLLIVLFGLVIILALGVPLIGLPLGWLTAQPLFNVQDSSTGFILWCSFVVVTIWLLLGLLYIPVVPVKFTKGLLLSAYEIALGGLANGLLLSLVLVIGAALQIGTGSGPNLQRSAAPVAPSPAATARTS